MASTPVCHATIPIRPRIGCRGTSLPRHNTNPPTYRPSRTPVCHATISIHQRIGRREHQSATPQYQSARGEGELLPGGPRMRSRLLGNKYEHL
jgi:hypothetical protein